VHVFRIVALAGDDARYVIGDLGQAGDRVFHALHIRVARIGGPPAYHTTPSRSGSLVGAASPMERNGMAGK